ncbi:MAG: GspH/FimT family pseudopilin [Coxiellaceae bacterium]|nr:GspH/FimT family pseudopilin [Coxiellaceae bacterium]
MVSRLKAITSIEVLIAIAIVAVLVSLAIPQYFNYIEDARIRHAAEDLYHKTMWARSTAIKNTQNVTTVVQAGGSWCYGFTTAATCDCNTANSCALGAYTSGEYPNTTMSVSGIASSTVYESTRGTITVPGTLTLSSGGQSASVVINKMGLSRICGTNISGIKAC